MTLKAELRFCLSKLLELFSEPQVFFTCDMKVQEGYS